MGGVTACTLAASDTAPTPNGHSAEDTLPAYMERLADLHSRWHRAARLVHEGKGKEAETLLGQPAPDGVPEVWGRQHESMANSLRYRRRWKMPQEPWWYMAAGAADLALEAYAKQPTRQQNPSHYSQCLVILGRYQEARAFLKGVLRSKDMASDWRSTFERRIETLNTLGQNAKPTLAFHRAYYLECSTGIDLTDILLVWRTPAEGPKAKEKGELLAALFREEDDPHGEKLALSWTAARTDDPAAAAEALVGAANAAHKAKRVADAIAGWRTVEARYPNTPAWGKAVFNIGLTLKEQGRHRDAIAQFRKMFEGEVNDRERGGHIMEAYRNYRPRAQWEIGHCYFALGEYRQALRAYETTERKYPFRSWCGTCMAEFKYDYAFRKGLCHDWLGETREALKQYYQAAFGFGVAPKPPPAIRMVDIYEAAGRLDAFESLLDAIDAWQRSVYLRMAEMEGSEVDPDRIKQFLPTRQAREVLAIRRHGIRKEWDALLPLLDKQNSCVHLYEHDAFRRTWQAVQAARLLTRDPAATRPLLVERLKHTEGYAIDWTLYALALCGGDEAARAIRTKVGEPYRTGSAIYALSLMGEKGRRAIDEIEAAGTETATGYIRMYREGTLGARNRDEAFPPVPENVQVPTRLAELDDRVAYEQSLPETVTVDRRTPEATLETLFTALLIADADAFMPCTDGRKFWKGVYRDIARKPGGRLTWEVGKAVDAPSGRAKVLTTLEIHRDIESRKTKTEKVVFVLEKRDAGWTVVGVEEPR